MPALARATPAAYPQGAAVCVGVDPDVFFPPGRSERLEQEAAQHCQACPLREQCLNYALAWDVYGIWGGTTYRQREQIRSTRGIAALPVLVGWIIDRSQPVPKLSSDPEPAPADTPDLDRSPEGDLMAATPPPPTPIDRARQNTTPEPGPEPHAVESVDSLLQAARELSNRKVDTAINKAETAISKLREVYTEAAGRIADEKAAQEAKDAALAEIARLKEALAVAEAAAVQAGAKLRKTPAKPKSSQSAKVREWAKEHGIDVPERGRIPGDVLAKYDAAHQAVAS